MGRDVSDYPEATYIIQFLVQSGICGIGGVRGNNTKHKDQLDKRETRVHL
jgi:hypothetical protein